MDKISSIITEVEWFRDRALLYQTLLVDTRFLEAISEAVNVIVTAVLNGKKLLIFGNGGSAAEAQHFAAEMVVKFSRFRRALPAIALTADTSIITAVSNDNGFDYIFLRQVYAFCAEGDVAIGLTTSDWRNKHSQNIAAGFEGAREMGAHTIGLFSQETISLLNYVDIAVQVPSTDTALVQEAHLATIHYLCDQIEKAVL